MHVAQSLLSYELICDPTVCLCVSSRLQLRLRGEEEGGVFGGAEERHSGLW